MVFAAMAICTSKKKVKDATHMLYMVKSVSQDCCNLGAAVCTRMLHLEKEYKQIATHTCLFLLASNSELCAPQYVAALGISS